LHRQFSRHVGGRSIRPPGYPFVSDFRIEAMIVTKIAKKGLDWHQPEFCLPMWCKRVELS
ncbi:MAG: hypothetical protein KAX58_08115, partial [Aeromonadaceae bacterium]|nr:hypothetical protein [Aeromonadaceae bacterium]